MEANTHYTTLSFLHNIVNGSKEALASLRGHIEAGDAATELTADLERLERNFGLLEDIRLLVEDRYSELLGRVINPELTAVTRSIGSLRDNALSIPSAARREDLFTIGAEQ